MIPKRKDMVGKRYVSSRTFLTLFLYCDRYIPTIKLKPKPKYFRFIENRVCSMFYNLPVSYSYAFFGPTFIRLEKL